MTSSLSTMQKTRLFFVSLSALITTALCLAVLTFLPQSRELIRSLIISNSRVILAKADADLTGQGQKVSIIKVQTADSLALEVFETDSQGQKLQFVKRLVLPERKDAYFNFRGNAANLVVTDVDGDGALEIVAPTFDDNLIPRLNVYKFDPETRGFFRLGPESVRL